MRDTANEMQEEFYREQELARESRHLPSALYNLTRTLLARSQTGCVFVPIRSMQYMAIIDAEEIVFVDSQHKRWIEVSWQSFKPGERESLDDAVAFESVYYVAEATETMKRLQGEFFTALRVLAARERLATPAKVLPFDRP